MKQNDKEAKSYKSMEIRFYQSDVPIMLDATLTAHETDMNTYNTWEFSLWDKSAESFLYKGNLRETIELIPVSYTHLTLPTILLV